jgi:hypothetical protein
MRYGNVTIDPRSNAIPARDAAIAEVINLDSGEILKTENLIASQRYGELITARLRVRPVMLP